MTKISCEREQILSLFFNEFKKQRLKSNPLKKKLSITKNYS